MCFEKINKNQKRKGQINKITCDVIPEGNLAMGWVGGYIRQ